MPEKPAVLMPTEVSSRVGFFDRVAGAASLVASRAMFFALCGLLIVLWAPSILSLHQIDTWQLFINTATMTITLLMVALLQTSRTRGDQAVQPKRNAIADGLADLMNHHADRTGAGDLRGDVKELRVAVGLEDHGRTTHNSSSSGRDTDPSARAPKRGAQPVTSRSCANTARQR